MSSVCNNLTTALLMGAVIMAMGKDNRRFVTLASINVVVATNAGGSFSPFGDITTLLVWQSGVVPFADFFSLFIPAIVNFALPAIVMHFWIPREFPAAVGKAPTMKRGALAMIVLFLLTIITAVCFENFLKLPPAAGMLAGLTYLKFLGYYLQKLKTRAKAAILPTFTSCFRLSCRPRSKTKVSTYSRASPTWNGTPCCFSTAS